MISKLPVIGWLLSFAASVSLSVPFWICWSTCGIGKTYFGFLPQQFHVIPFWNCVGLFIVVGILKGMVHGANAEETTITLEGTTTSTEPTGDWEIKIRRVKRP